ncbi:cytochrome P450 [Macrolepiota fuliginosa MF-IS2]|uniref:Cytochrome P450 n=1 Tax=Macrolepiota fuliginosa MF-IS2 TaxID=1400762 RepID=A0A9P5XE17_9AGAR|nr:cytochrome P450 [Macrolepiota fuliginosa MF-IS2]
MLGLQEVAVLSLCLTVLLYIYRKRKSNPLPPGIPRWPIVGNALSIPMDYTHRFYKQPGEKLGSKILYLEAFGQPMVILNDHRMAKDLLEKRSSIYSSRMKIDLFFSFFPYGDAWRRDRRLFTQYFSPKTLHRDQERIVDFVRKGLLPNLYHSPSDFRSHIRSCMEGFAIAIAYGLQVRRTNDPIIGLSEDAFSAITSAVAPGRFLVDVFPILKYVPGWVPGANFQKLARRWKALIMQVTEDSYEAAVKTMNNGTAQKSFASDNLTLQSEGSDPEVSVDDIKRIGQQVYGAGSETTVASSITFILAMLKYPDIQKRAQRELDSVLGLNRLPDLSDQAQLPYLSAIMEVLRWNPIVPLGVPHFTDEEDVYEGYYTPKGSIVIANAYGMLYDKEIFPDPHVFQPERFLKDGKLSPDMTIDPEVAVTFGFGRRICPGAYLALPLLYLTAASILTVFDILPELDAEGSPLEVVPEFSAASLVSEPLPFRCQFVPRKGKNVENLLKDYLHVEII